MSNTMRACIHTLYIRTPTCIPKAYHVRSSVRSTIVIMILRRDRLYSWRYTYLAVLREKNLIRLQGGTYSKFSKKKVMCREVGAVFFLALLDCVFYRTCFYVVHRIPQLRLLLYVYKNIYFAIAA